MAMKIQVVVFGVLTPCSDVVGPLKCWYSTTSLHSIRTHKTMTCTFLCYHCSLYNVLDKMVLDIMADK